jgi:hypothetical protein
LEVINLDEEPLRAYLILAPLECQNKVTLNDPIKNVFHSNLHTTSKDAPKTYLTWKVLYAMYLTKSHVGLKALS